MSQRIKTFCFTRWDFCRFNRDISGKIREVKEQFVIFSTLVLTLLIFVL